MCIRMCLRPRMLLACPLGARRGRQRDGRRGTARRQRLLRGGRNVATEPDLTPLQRCALLARAKAGAPRANDAQL